MPTTTGILKIHFDGYGFLIPSNPNEKDVFIPSRYLAHALPYDLVLVKYEEKNDGRRDGSVAQVLKRGRSQWVGILEQKGGAYSVVNKDYSFEIRVHVDKKHLNKARIGQVVAVRVIDFSENKGLLKGEIVEVLGESHEKDVETRSILARHGLCKDFPKNVQMEIGEIDIQKDDKESKKRMNLCHLPFVTIDGVHARDFDDAVYAEKKGDYFYLYVSIADVAQYVLEGTNLDEEAMRRGTSAYFPNFVVSMLPSLLSNDICSLRPGEIRQTLTCEMKFDLEGHLKGARYYESLIISQKRGIYDDVQSYFDGDIVSEEQFAPDIKKSLKTLKKLAEVLMRQRKIRGSIDFDLPEDEVIYNHAGEIETIKQAKRFFSHRLIEELMIMANVAVAELFCALNIPILYRIHDDPNPEKVESFVSFVRELGIKFFASKVTHSKEMSKLFNLFRDHPMEEFLHLMFLRSMRQAFYSPQTKGHFGLNLKHYSHFTSPIRRYPDLVVHRQLKKLLNHTEGGVITLQFVKKGKKFQPQVSPPIHKKQIKGLYTCDDLHKIGDMNSNSEREAMEAEREMLHLIKTQFMEKHLGETFYGTINKVAKFGLFVSLDPHHVNGLLHIKNIKGDYYLFDEKKMQLRGRKNKKRVYKIGDRIRVVVDDLSFAERMVYLRLA